MNNLTVKFNDGLIKGIVKVNNNRCCSDGVICFLDLENMTIGKNYLCEFSNIGPGTIFFRPQNVVVSANTKNRNIAVALELTGSRYAVIKATITNQDDPNDKAEDIVTVECGSPTLFNIEFDEETLTIDETASCSDNKLIVAYINNAQIGKTYNYQFLSPDQSTGLCQMIPSSGTIKAGDNKQNIGTIFKYSGSNKNVSISLIVSDTTEENLVSRIETLIDCKSCSEST
jgi:hypothetical protein